MTCLACLERVVVGLYLMQRVLFRHKFIAFWVTSATGRVVEDLLAAASSAAFSASVKTSLSIINVPYVAIGDLVVSSLSTLTVTSLSHVTEVLSPAFNAGTLFYKVNVTSLTYTGTPGPGAMRLRASKYVGKLYSTAPAYQEIEGACLGPRCNHNNLHRAAFLQPELVLTSYG